jgi:DNA-binding transcriptional ArsR family regulator
MVGNCDIQPLSEISIDRIFSLVAEYHFVGHQESHPRVDAYETVFAALAHAARRRVLLTIYFNGGSMKAGEIAAIFDHAWQTTTRHLQVLEAAGLLTHERQGRMRIYRIQRKRLELVKDWLAHFSRNGKS